MIFVLKKIVMEALKYLFWVLQSQPVYLRGNMDAVTQPSWGRDSHTPPISAPSAPQLEVSLGIGQGSVPPHTVHKGRTDSPDGNSRDVPRGWNPRLSTSGKTFVLSLTPAVKWG